MASLPADRTADEYFIELALEEAARAAAIGEVPVGCVLVEATPTGPQVVARGHNLRETLQDPTAHAEMVALRRASALRGSWRLSGITAYVTLEPCAMCAGALVNARVDRVVYGAVDPKAGATETLYEIGSDPRLNHCFERKSGILADRCGRILSDFFRQIRAAGGAAKRDGV